MLLLAVQVDKLQTELEAKLKDIDSLEARVTEAENKLTELNLKLENVMDFMFNPLFFLLLSTHTIFLHVFSCVLFCQN